MGRKEMKIVKLEERKKKERDAKGSGVRQISGKDLKTARK